MNTVPGANAADVVIIGGGPAGLAAAVRCCTAGLTVVVVEENPNAGGKLRGQLHQERRGRWWIGWQLAEDLTAKAAAAGAQIRTETVAWAIEPGWLVRTASSRGGDTRAISARAVLIATGAVERPMPLPGWTLPGVYSIGGAQVLTNTHRVRLGNRTLVVGVDPLSLTIARAMQLAGVEVASIVLPPASVSGSNPAATLGRLGTISALAPSWYLRAGGALLRAVPQLTAIAARLLPRSILVWGIPLRLGTRVVRILGDREVTGVELELVRASGAAVPDSRHTLSVDSVCLSNGLLPLNDLSASLGLDFVHSSALGARVPVHSATGATQLPGLLLAGNAIGVEGAKVALRQGQIAAGEIIEQLGVRRFDTRDAELTELARLRATSEFTFVPEIQAGHDTVAARFRQQQATVRPEASHADEEQPCSTSSYHT